MQNSDKLKLKGSTFVSIYYITIGLELDYTTINLVDGKIATS